jgi:hypothetical protein
MKIQEERVTARISELLPLPLPSKNAVRSTEDLHFSGLSPEVVTIMFILIAYFVFGENTPF